MTGVLLHLGVLAVPLYGVLVALGVLAALVLSQGTAKRVGLDAAKLWNLGIAMVFTAVLVERGLLIAMNWRDVMRYPLWVFGLAMVHSPGIYAAGVLSALLVAAIYAGRERMPVFALLDALAAPIALGMAVEQVASFFAGTDYGTVTEVAWSVAQHGAWRHPVQLYAAAAYLVVAVVCLWLLQSRRGDAAGVGLMGMGISLFVTELFRASLTGAIDTAQCVALGLILLAAGMLCERKKVSVR